MVGAGIALRMVVAGDGGGATMGGAGGGGFGGGVPITGAPVAEGALPAPMGAGGCGEG
jgi:hypothetical protein